MIFFVIVPSVMIVAIILVHEAAKYFGKKVSYSSLIICAVFSFLVDIAAFFSAVSNRDYFFNLFMLIFVAAAVVTALNRFLEVRR